MGECEQEKERVIECEKKNKFIKGRENRAGGERILLK
jgi:hypothetical protein